MNESEWLASNDVPAMIDTLREFYYDDDEGILWETLHRYYVACCRRIWPLLPQEESRRSVEVAERYLSGQATEDELLARDWYAEGAAFLIEYNSDPPAIERWVADVAAIPEAELRAMLHPPGTTPELPTRELLLRAAYFASYAVVFPGIRPKWPVREGYVVFMPADLLRQTFGNPFRSRRERRSAVFHSQADADLEPAPMPPGQDPELPNRRPAGGRKLEPLLTAGLRAVDVLRRLGIRWDYDKRIAEDFGNKPLEEWWASSRRADIMILCLPPANTTDDDYAARRRMVRTGCRFARMALHLIPANEKRCLRALETAEAWSRWEPGVSLADVMAAADGADASCVELGGGKKYAQSVAAAAVHYAVFAADTSYPDGSGSHFGSFASALDAAAVSASEWQSNGFGSYREAHRQFLADAADIIREEYSDVRAALTARQAEMNVDSAAAPTAADGPPDLN